MGMDMDKGKADMGWSSCFCTRRRKICAARRAAAPPRQYPSLNNIRWIPRLISYFEINDDLLLLVTEDDFTFTSLFINSFCHLRGGMPSVAKQEMVSEEKVLPSVRRLRKSLQLQASVHTALWPGNAITDQIILSDLFNGLLHSIWAHNAFLEPHINS